MGQTNETTSDFDARIEKWKARYEKQKQAGWVHSMCLGCFRQRWPHGFCLQKHKDGIHKTRDPLNRELRCAGIHRPERPGAIVYGQGRRP